ncbi:hypothetical protein [Nocardioides sp. NPDC004968]
MIRSRWRRSAITPAGSSIPTIPMRWIASADAAQKADPVIA